MTREQLATEWGEDLLFLDPPEMFDQAIIGVVQRFNSSFVLYDRAKILLALTDDGIEEGLDPIEAEAQAIEHFEFNIVGGWVGDTTPGFLLTTVDDIPDDLSPY